MKQENANQNTLTQAISPPIQVILDILYNNSTHDSTRRTNKINNEIFDAYSYSNVYISKYSV